MFMETLKNHTLIYDDQCPLCKTYSRAFVKYGLLDSNGREAYSEVRIENSYDMDWNRARNEIALVNRKNNTVVYGIDSLLFVIGHSIPLLKPVLRFKPLQVLLRILYAFISFNRKVIAPGKAFEAPNACTPDLNYVYRWAFIAAAWLATSTVLVYYSKLVFPLVPETNFFREFLICGGQVVFQGALVIAINRKRTIHYLGNMMTISFGGALLLCPAFLCTGFITTPIFYLTYFATVVGLMFLEHLRRVKLLWLPWLVSAGWVLYRLIVLLIIYKI